MTKRPQSGGAPTGATPATPPPAPRGGKALREYRSRAEREAEIQKMVIRGTLIAVAVVAVILVIALVIEFFVTPNQAVASVNGQTINVAQFRDRVRLERALINERLQEVIEDARIFPEEQANQFIQFRLSQEPFATWMQELQLGDQLGNRVLNDMIDEVLVREKAAELGITVSEEDIQAEINEYFEYNPAFEPESGLAESTAEATGEPATATPTPFVSPTPSPVPSETPTPTITPTPEVSPTPSLTPAASATPAPTLNPTERAEQFNERAADAFANVRSSAGVGQDAIDRYFETQALRKKVAEQVLADSLTTTQQEVLLRHILVATEEEALDVQAALQAGESFAELARAVSTDTGSAANGGEYDWAPASQYVGPFAEAAETAEIGEFYGPVETEFGFHIIQVRGRRDAPMSDAEISAARDEQLEEYLDTLREEQNVETFSVWADNVPAEPIFRPR